MVVQQDAAIRHTFLLAAIAKMSIKMQFFLSPLSYYLVYYWLAPTPKYIRKATYFSRHHSVPSRGTINTKTIAHFCSISLQINNHYNWALICCYLSSAGCSGRSWWSVTCKFSNSIIVNHAKDFAVPATDTIWSRTSAESLQSWLGKISGEDVTAIVACEGAFPSVHFVESASLCYARLKDLILRLK